MAEHEEGSGSVSDQPLLTEAEVQRRVREHQAAAGKVGGMSRSDRKRASSSANLAKARLRRWPGRELAATAASKGLEGLNGDKPEAEHPMPSGSEGASSVGGPCGPSPSSDEPDPL